MLGYSKANQKEAGKDQTGEKASPSGALDGGTPAGIPLFLQSQFGAVQAKRGSAADAPFERESDAGRAANKKYEVGPPGDAFELEADRVADQVAARSGQATLPEPGTTAAQVRREATGLGAPSTIDAGELPRGAGSPLPTDVRSLVEPVLGHDLGHVRVHGDAAGREKAAELHAKAFTLGSDIWLGRGASEHDTRLMAHEATHVVQQGAAIRRKHDPFGASQSDFDPNAAVSDAPPFVDTTTLIIPGSYDVEIPLTDPDLDQGDPEKRRDKTTIVVHTPVAKDGQLSLKFYAVPVSKLLKGVTAAKPASPAPAPAKTAPPTVTTAPANNPDFPPGSTVKTLDGTALEVLASTRDHVITSKYTKFAVGAASTSALKLVDGSVVVIDAGVNPDRTGYTTEALSKLTMDKLAEFIGEGTIRDFLISHAHGDHISLAPLILGRFPVDTIRINDVQKRYPGYKALRKAMVAAMETFRKARDAKVRAEIESGRAAWELTQPSTIDEGARQEKWNEHVAKELQKRTGPATRESVPLQAKGGKLDVADIELKTDAEAAPRTFGENDPVFINETMAPVTNDKVVDRRRNTEKSKVDPNASAYVITLPSGLRFLVIPDIRANDMQRLAENFADAVKAVSKGQAPVRVQIWDATHHMQRGWYGGGVPATQLQKIIGFLHQFSAKKGADAVIVSAQADLKTPGASTKIDPVNLWVLRELGFEAYLATSDRDVRLFDITTSDGQHVTGIAGDKGPGKMPSELSIRRAKDALEKLSADRLTQEAALRDETDAGKRGEIEQALKDIAKQRAEIQAALEAYVKAGHQKLASLKPKGGHTTQSVNDALANEPAPAERAALDAVLTKYNFDRPVTSDLHLTDVALVLIKQPTSGAPPEPGSPAARAHQLRESRSRITEIGLRIKTGESGPAIQEELVTELTAFKSLLETELNPPDPAQKPAEGTSRALIEATLKGVNEKLATVVEDQGGKTLSRTVGSGEIIEEHVVKLKAPVEAPSTATRLTGQTLEVVGRGLGAVMVVNTIRGQGELYKRWQEGRAGAAEMTLGTAHNLGSAAAGVQMVRGVHVSNGVFVVLSIIDIGQAMARTYSSTEERNIAITYTVIASALNLALMIAGQALMKIPNPVTMIAGFLLSFAGPAIMDALGIADWLERRYGFNPSDVIQVYQTLRKLVQEYSVVVGAITLADRNAQGMSDLQVKDPDTFRAQAAEAARQSRLKAIPLERDILIEFHRAYEDAKTNYAGLKELDEYREQFLTLHHQANPGNEEVTAWQAKYGAERDEVKDAARQDPDPCHGKYCTSPSDKLAYAEAVNPEPRGRKGIEEVFKGIEAKMSIDGMSEDAIRDMPQWKKLNSKLDDLSDAINEADEATEEKDVEKLHKEDREAEAMISNARYRLDPAHQGGLRTTALLSANAPGRALYEQLLSRKEKRLSELRYRYTVRTLAARGIPIEATPSSGGPAPSLAEQLLTQIEGTMGRYEARLTMSAPPKELVVGLFTNSDTAAKYEQYLKEHSGYAMDLVRFEILEGMIDGLIEQAWRPLRAKGAQSDDEEVKRLNKIAEKRRALHKKRYDELGIVFRSELPGLTHGVKSYEASELALLLGEKPGTKLLSREEITALKSSQLEDQGVVGPIANRLMALPALGTTDSAGHLRNIYRFVGWMMYWEGDWIKVGKGDTIRPEQNVIVGAIGPGEVNQPSWDTPGRPTTRIIPINQAAVVAFRGEKTKDVFPSDLQAITKEEIKP